MKRSDSGGEGSSSKRLREDLEQGQGRRRDSHDGSSSSPGSGHSGQYAPRGRGFHSQGEGRGGDRHERSSGSSSGGNGYRDRDRDFDGEARGSPAGGSRRDSFGSGNGEGNGRGRPLFNRRDSNGGGSDDGRREFNRGGGRGGRPPFTGRGGPSRGEDRGGGRGGGRGRGRGGRGRGRPRRDYRAEELARHDLVVSAPAREDGAAFSKCGTKGSQVVLTSNYFTVKKRPDWCIFHYRVDFVPDEERTFIKKQLLHPHRPHLGAHIFDGASLYTITEVPEEYHTLYSYAFEGSTDRIEIKMRKVAEVTPTDVMYIQVLNIIVRGCLSKMGMEEMGRNFFDAKQAKRLEQQRLELWPGYKTTIRHHENDVLLGVEMTHKVLRLDDCLSVLDNTQGNDKTEYRRNVMREIVGNIVMTHYNRKTYRIDDIDWDKTPGDTFTSQVPVDPKKPRGEKKDVVVSFAEYMEQRYNVKIRNLRQPLLISRPKKRDMHRGMSGPILLIPELCQMTGLTDRQREDHTFMRGVNQHLHLDPQKRVDHILKFMEKLTTTREIREEQDKWGLRFEQSLVTVNARILPIEPIFLGRDRKVAPNNEEDWTNSLKDNHMKMCVNLTDWVVIAPSRDRQSVDKIVNTLKNVARNMNFMISQPKEVKYVNQAAAQEYFQAIAEAVSTHKELQMVFAILGNSRPDTYIAIKKRCCYDYAISSQCFQAKNVHKNLMSICSKTVIQMNAKLGGQPWNVGGLPPGIMIVGFDVYHCGKRKNESYGATVASTNATCSKFFSTVSPHSDQGELSSSLCTDITKCLHVFKLTNEKLPEKIVMFRDGVGEGQLTYVYNTELGQIKNAIRSVYGEGNEPKIAFIVVTKKINTRIFAPNQNGRGVINPPPGTIVDSVVTLPERYDFFLVSQSVRQGTVSPTSYNVLEDTIKYPPDRMQKLTYMMTHMYYNSSATVAVPAPCQYAHKLAYLSGAVLKCSADDKLSDRLYYL